tara:strand:- start:422 stop:583 length:162 start_codon:yes stop_codon:yes gene_type:complete
MRQDDFDMLIVGLMIIIGIILAFFNIKLIGIAVVGLLLLLLDEFTFWRSVFGK